VQDKRRWWGNRRVGALKAEGSADRLAVPPPGKKRQLLLYSIRAGFHKPAGMWGSNGGKKELSVGRGRVRGPFWGGKK